MNHFLKTFYKYFSIFSMKACLDNLVLNILGIQVFRILVARGKLKLRRLFLYDRECEFSNILIKDGFVAIESFLSDEEFKALKEDTEIVYSGKESKIIDPAYPEDLLMYSYDDSLMKNFDSFKKLTENPLIKKIFKNVMVVEQHINNWNLQKLVYEDKSDIYDSQNILHVDTFFTNLKLFFYLEDTGENDAPFKYSKGSHIFSFKRLKFDYLRSIKNIREGAWAIKSSEYDQLNLDPKPAVFKANTLVLADVSGFHGRGTSHPGLIRKTVRASLRLSPFF
jgi:hypothetical protein